MVRGFSPVDQSPIPGTPAEQFDYSWIGSGSSYSLRLTFTRGAVAGILDGPVGRFWINRLNTHELRTSAYPVDDSAGNDAAIVGKSVIATKTAAAHVGDAKASGPNDIDMLVLYTEEARVAAGGPAGQCNGPQDAAGILAVINQALVDTNTSFANSQVTTRLGNVTIKRLVGFPLPNGIPNVSRDNAARNSANIQAERTAAGADVVSVLVDSHVTLGVCGVAFVQRPGCTLPTATPGCGVGATFNAFAYNVVSQTCAIVTDAFAHEFGHNLGGEHNPENGPTPAQASFPHSFGHFVNGAFETVMSVRRPVGTPQILNFSNPNVVVGVQPTGVVGTRNNALTVNTLSPTFRLFRDGAMFADSFEDAAVVDCPTIAF